MSTFSLGVHSSHSLLRFSLLAALARSYELIFSSLLLIWSRHVRLSLISGQIRVLARVSRYSPGLRQHTATKALRYLFSFLHSFPCVEATRRSDYLACLTQSKDCRRPPSTLFVFCLLALSDFQAHHFWSPPQGGFPYNCTFYQTDEPLYAGQKISTGDSKQQRSSTFNTPQRVSA